MEHVRVTTKRFFAVAPLIPCDIDGSTDAQPMPNCYKAGTYGDGFLTLAEAMPPGVDFYIGGSQDAPAWAKEAFDNLDTLIGVMSGIAVYRYPSRSDVRCLAFVELINGQPVMPQDRGVAFQPERYKSGELFAHDLDVTIVNDVVFVNDEEEERHVHGIKNKPLQG